MPAPDTTSGTGSVPNGAVPNCPAPSGPGAIGAAAIGAAAIGPAEPGAAARPAPVTCPTAGPPTAPPTGPALASSQAGNDCRPARNSVTIAKPEGSVAVSRIRFLSGPDSRLSCTRRRSTSSGPAASARCTMTTRPVASSCALCVRMPSATATHLSSRYRVLKSSLMSRRSVGKASSATTRQPSRRCILQLFTPRRSRATDRASYNVPPWCPP